MSSVVSGLLEGDVGNLDELLPGLHDQSEPITRHLALITMPQLKKLLHLLSRPGLLTELSKDDAIVELQSNLRKLPKYLRQPDAGTVNGRLSPPELAKSDSLSPSNKRKSLPNRFGRHGRLLPGRDDDNAGGPEHEMSHRVHGDSQRRSSSDNTEVLMVSLCDMRDPVGLLNEGRYLLTLKPIERTREKRTRFVDTESVATSGDQFDVASEGNSLSSSLDGLTNAEDISTLADNFSDVVEISANVSGRGSPNISGRETPLSQHTTEQQGAEVEDVPSISNGMSQAERHLPHLPDTVKKENREDLEEKFGKFGLPPPMARDRLRDETHSMVSDSWSTDVVPSDNEGAGEASSGLQPPGGIVPAGTLPDVVPGAPPDLPRLDLIREETAAAAAGAEAVAAAIEDRSDTWSVDAIASDSEAEPARGEEMADLDDVGSDIGAAGETVAAAEDDLTENVDVGELDVEPSSEFYPIPDVRFMDTSNDGQTTPPVTKFVPPPEKTENAPLTKENLRRQSSGSSFYSRSDVDSEFSRDFPEDSSCAFVGDFPQPPSSRGSISESATTGIRKTDDLIMLGHDELPQENSENKGNSKKSDGNLSSTVDSPHTVERQSLGRLSFVLGDDSTKLSKENGSVLVNVDTIMSGKVPQSSGNSTNSSEASGDDSRRAAWRAAGAIPKSSRQSRQAVRPGDVKHGAHKKMTGLLHGLQKVGDSLIRGSGRPSLSPFRSSKTVDDISSISRNQPPPSVVPQSHSSNQLSADEILNKYSHTNKPVVGPTRITVNQEPQDEMDTTVTKEESSRPYYDPENVTRCQAFLDAKRKLRVVLCSIDIQSLPTAAFDTISSENSSTKAKDDDLIKFLRLLLAEAINGQQRTLSAQLREVIRCLTVFDHKGIKKLVRVLKEEHRRRSTYLSYLQQSRLNLLQMRSNLIRWTMRIERDQELTGECQVEMLVRLFMQQQETRLRQFVAEFQTLVAQDEKTDHVENFLSRLHQFMADEAAWRLASEGQIEYAHKSLERSLMAQVYLAALYPNGDADVCRDQVLHEYMAKLAAVISPSHRALAIPLGLRAECPWPSAQAEISIINAYKSPFDKLCCVVRCCETIQNLITLAIAKPSAADHILPVLVYVLIQANPPALLSNIQYVQGFYSNRMEGSEAYWWTQFTSAVEFIKSLFNKNL